MGTSIIRTTVVSRHSISSNHNLFSDTRRSADDIAVDSDTNRICISGGSASAPNTPTADSNLKKEFFGNQQNNKKSNLKKRNYSFVITNSKQTCDSGESVDNNKYGKSKLVILKSKIYELKDKKSGNCAGGGNRNHNHNHKQANSVNSSALPLSRSNLIERTLQNCEVTKEIEHIFIEDYSKQTVSKRCT